MLKNKEVKKATIKSIIETEIKPKIDLIIVELDKIPNPKILEEGEKLHRELSFVSVDDLLKRFTI